MLSTPALLLEFYGDFHNSGRLRRKRTQRLILSGRIHSFKDRKFSASRSSVCPRFSINFPGKPELKSGNSL